LDAFDPSERDARMRGSPRSPHAADASEHDADATTASAALRELAADPSAGRLGLAAQRIDGVSALQRTVGNVAVGRMLSVQRHPEGAGLTIDPEAAVSDAQSETPAPATESVAEAQAGLPGVEAAPAPEATGGEAATESAPATGAGVTPEAEDPKKVAPKPAKPAYLDLATAKTVLEKTYGKTYTISTGKIELLEDKEAIWKKYDEVAIGDKVAGWKEGDAKTRYPLGINGFYDKTGGTSYVNKASALATTTPHEMLHANTAANFRSSVGETLNEGVTQWLCVKALKDSSITVPTALPYADEVGVAQALIDLVGESMVQEAYFKGGDATTKLTGEVDKKQGAGEFAKVKSEGDKKDYTKAKDLLKPKPKKTDAAMIDTNEYGEAADTAYA
jgi:hypothetical protein